MSNLPDRRSGPKATAGADAIDLREALYNDGPVGPAGLVQVPTGRITRLDGLMLDLDPSLLAPGNPLFPPADEPREFFSRIRPVLDRHPLLRHAEVRSSGRGLHLILTFDPPVELASAAAQKSWSTLVRVVQRSLPADPNAPGITALTRPVGSVNPRNGAVVEVLRPGQSVDPVRVEAFVRQMDAAPFRSVANFLLGQERVEPCPICLRPGSSLGVHDRGGTCYTCGPITLEKLYEVAYRASNNAGGPGEADGEDKQVRAEAAPRRKTAVLRPRKPRLRKTNSRRRSAS
jgi:hypothetical protein